MSVDSPADDDALPPPEPAWHEFARAPLVPFALAASVGLLVDFRALVKMLSQSRHGVSSLQFRLQNG